MIYDQTAGLRQRIRELTHRHAPLRIKILENTSQFMSIDTGDVLRLGGNDYLVTGNAREGRFGIDDQPKFWVKSAVDLTSGVKKIIKLVFNETFTSRVGPTVYRCHRSPEKESEILRRMQGNPNFMQGRTVRDAAGNGVRIIDFIFGPSLYDYLRRLKMPHAQYYQGKFAMVMQQFLVCVQAIADLHRQGLHHGDVRADHIILQNETGNYVWIDFDYEVDNTVYDVFCLGNSLLQVVGKGRHSLDDIRDKPWDYPGFNNNLAAEDMSLMFSHRVANLRKLFPCIPEALNSILLRFSAGAAEPYQSVDSLLADLRALFPG